MVIAVAGGVVLAAVAGARRTDSAYPRFLRAQNAGQGAIASDPGHFFGFANVDFSKVEAIPGLIDSARFAFFIGFIHTPSGRDLTPLSDRNPVVMFSSPDDRFDHVLNEMRVVEGRLPRTTSADEVAVSSQAAARYRIRVGDVLSVHLPRFQDFTSALANPTPTGPLFNVRVTGIEIAPGELGTGVGYPPLHFPSAFYKRYVSSSPTFPAISIKLRSDAELSQFVEQVQTNAIVDPKVASRIELLSFVENTKAIARTTRVQATALRLLALLMALTGLLILIQTIARQTFLESFDYETLGALGFTRRQLFGTALVRTTLAGLIGAVAAAGFAFALSDLTPIGIARVAEPSRGLQLDPLVLVLGGLSIALVVLALAIYPAWRASRIARLLRRESVPRTSRVAESLSGAGLPPAGLAGMRMALETGRGRSAVPVRSTIAGAVIGIAAIATALTFAASIKHAVHTPRIQGVNWDGVIGDGFDPDDSARIIPILERDPQVVEFSAGGAGTLTINGHGVTTIGMDQIRGRIEPVMIGGRAPYRDDELVLGVRTMREVGTHVGGIVTVSSGPKTARMRVVGQAVAPTVAGEAFSGRGAYMTDAGLRTLLPGNAVDIFLFRVRARGQLPNVIARIHGAIPAIGVRPGGPAGGDVDELSHVGNLPLLLAGLLTLLSIATLAHLIVTALRTRSSQLAILKTLGFVRRQVRATVAWQATTLAVVAVVIALPVGYVAGRLTWGVLANQIGFVSEPVVTAWQLFAVVPAMIIAANLVAILPARRAARTKAAVQLRSE